MRACVHVCVRVCMCVCVLDRDGSRVIASRALAVVWMTVYSDYLTVYSDYLSGFCELLSSPYRHHTSLNNV